MSAVYDETWVDPWEGQPDSITVDMRAPGWREALRAKAEADAAYDTSGFAADVLDEIEQFGGLEVGAHMFTTRRMRWQCQQSISLPREVFRDLQQVKAQRTIIRDLYQKFFESAIVQALCRRQAERAKRSRQHKRRLAVK